MSLRGTCKCTDMALYMKAAEILDKVEQKKGAVKTLVYDSKFKVIIC